MTADQNLADALSNVAKRLAELDAAGKAELARVGRLFGPTDELVRYYLQPDVQQVNPADAPDDDSGLIARAPVFRPITAFFRAPDRFRHAVILSDSGMGKTSLLIMLRLLHLTGVVAPQHRMTLLKLGQATLAELEAIEDPASTILLLDALDEDPDAWSGFGQRMALLLQRTNTFRKVIMTCRTQFFPHDLEKDGHFTGTVKIAGFSISKSFLSPFSDEHVDEYLHRRLESVEEIERAKRIVARMHSLKFRPMLLAYIHDFLPREDQELRDTYSIYNILVEAWLDREMSKGVVKDAAPLMDVCMAIAVRLYNERAREIAYEDVQRLCQSLPAARSLEYMSVEGRSLLNRTSEGRYRFAHQSILEFFVATALFKGVVTAKELPAGLSDQVRAFLADLVSRRRFGACDGLDLSRTQIADAELKAGSFQDANLTETAFTNCQLRKADFRRAKLERLRVLRCDLTKANFEGQRARSARFKNCTLNQGRLGSATFESGSFRGVLIREAACDGLTFLECSFRDGSESVTLPTEPVDELSRAACDFDGLRLENVNAAGLRFEKPVGRIEIVGGSLNDLMVLGDQKPVIQLVNVALTNAHIEGTELRAVFDIQGLDLAGVVLQNCSGEISYKRGTLKKVKVTTGRLLSFEIAQATASNIEFTVAENAHIAITHSTVSDLTISGTQPRPPMNTMLVARNSELSEVKLERCQVSLRMDETRVRGLTTLDAVVELGEASQCSLHAWSWSKGQLFSTQLDDVTIDDGSWDTVALLSVRLIRCSLLRTTFTSCELTNVTLTGTTLESVTFEQCMLNDVNFTNATFKAVSFKGSFYDSKVKWPAGFDYANCGAVGPGANLRGVRWRGRRLSNRDLKRVDLSGSQLADGGFREGLLDEAILADARLQNMDLLSARLVRADLRRAQFTECDLRGADLTDAKVENASFAGCRYDASTRFPTRDFKPEEWGMVRVSDVGVTLDPMPRAAGQN